MTTDTSQDVSRYGEEFSRRYSRPRRGSVAEMVQFVVSTRKWWLIPVLIALAIAGILMVLGGTAVAPFIYPVF